MIPRYTDHAANERTFLAWIRTAIAVMAFGLVIERFDLFLNYFTQARHLTRTTSLLPARWVGIALVLVGACIVIAASWRFFRDRQAIACEQTMPFKGRVVGVLALLMVVLALVLSFYLLSQWW